MKKFVALTMIGLAVTMAAAMAENVVVEVAAAPTSTTVVGTVKVETDATGEVCSVTIQVKDQAVAVVLDENGKKLVALKGQKVQVVGVETEAGLKVSSFEAIQ